MRTMLYSLALLGSLLLLDGCQSDRVAPAGKGTLRLEFNHVADGQRLEQGTGTYTNDGGEPFQVNQFKYYISNIRLRREDGSQYIQPESYFLIDEEEAQSKVVTIPDVPEGSYREMQFTIGVDSLRNTSGAQTGALDPIHGMFWTWNTGYIFVRLEGTSPVSTQTNNRIVYHIGGYRDNTNAIREAAFPLTGNAAQIRPGKTLTARYQVDIAQLFKGPYPVSFATLPTSMGGPTAVQIADNYQDMFTLISIENEN